MRYWYAYTGENLILGRGRAIRQVVSSAQVVQRLFDAAAQYYAPGTSADKDTFIAALIAPLAMQELGTASSGTTAFSSAGQVLRLFDEVHIEQAAVNLFNGRVASAYAQDDADATAARVAQGFGDGDLLSLPRDEARLHARETLDTLPGAAAFLLARSQEERKAFAFYLRRGTPPAVPPEAAVAIARLRPVLPTWKRREAAP